MNDNLQDLKKDIESLSDSIITINYKISLILKDIHDLKVKVSNISFNDIYKKFEYIDNLINSSNLSSIKNEFDDLKNRIYHLASLVYDIQNFYDLEV